MEGNSQSTRFGPCQCLPGGDSAAPSASPLPQPAPTCSQTHILIYPWYAAAMRPASRRAGRRPEVEGGGQSSAHTRQSGTWASDGKRTHVQGDGKASGACKCRVVHAQLATVLGTVDAVASAKVCGHKACRCLYSASLKRVICKRVGALERVEPRRIQRPNVLAMRIGDAVCLQTLERLRSLGYTDGSGRRESASGSVSAGTQTRSGPLRPLHDARDIGSGRTSTARLAVPANAT